MQLPFEVGRAAAAVVGEPYDATPLAGLSGVTVAELHGPRGRVVAKGPVTSAEHHVTTVLEPALRVAGVRLARCLGTVMTPEGAWLLLEHLPEPLPRDRWGPDPEVLDVLRSLHGVAPRLLDEVPGRYRPRWDDEMTAQAARVMDVDVRDLQRRAAPLHDPVAVVSADPNPLNWRLDADGRVCLVDQGRLTLARTEVDLAIVLPGLPTRAEAEAVVVAYGAGDADLVLLAKAWTVVELAATTPRAVADLGPTFGTWVATELA